MPRIGTPVSGKVVTTFTVAASDASVDSKSKADYLCDGINDEVQIIAAISALPSGGGQVNLTEGIFIIEATVTFSKDNVKLQGRGRSTVLFSKAGLDFNCVRVLSRTNVHLDSFCVDGNKANNTPLDDEDTQNNIVLAICVSCRVTNCYSINSSCTGILLQGSNTHCIVQGNHVLDCHRNGIYLLFSNNNYNSIIGNVVKGSVGYHGINMSSSSYNTVSQNVCQDNGQNGIDIDGDSVGNAVMGNACTENGWAGLCVRGETGTPIYNVYTANACTLNGRQGIRIQGGQKNTISNNTCYNNSQELGNWYSGIRFDDEFGYTAATGNMVMGNRVATNHKYGIEVMGAGDNNYIAHNWVDGVTAATYTDAGATGNKFESNQYTVAGVATRIESPLLADSATDVTASAAELNYVDGVTSSIQTQLGDKASLALANLASVAINTSLISDTDSTDDLGSSSKYWANTYTDKMFLNATATLDGSGAGTVTLTGALTTTGAYTFTTAASGLVLKRGANGKCGTFVANGVTPVTISNTSIAITDTIVISLNTVGGTVGVQPNVATITAGTGFTVVCTALDTSTYNYAIISNAA